MRKSYCVDAFILFVCARTHFPVPKVSFSLSLTPPPPLSLSLSVSLSLSLSLSLCMYVCMNTYMETHASKRRTSTTLHESWHHSYACLVCLSIAQMWVSMNRDVPSTRGCAFWCTKTLVMSVGWAYLRKYACCLRDDDHGDLTSPDTNPSEMRSAEVPWNVGKLAINLAVSARSCTNTIVLTRSGQRMLSNDHNNSNLKSYHHKLTWALKPVKPDFDMSGWFHTAIVVTKWDVASGRGGYRSSYVTIFETKSATVALQMQTEIIVDVTMYGLAANAMASRLQTVGGHGQTDNNLCLLDQKTFRGNTCWPTYRNFQASRSREWLCDW